MNRRKKQRCPNVQCEGGFVYTFRDIADPKPDPTQTALPATEVTRTLCPVCKGLQQVRPKR